MLSGRPGFRFVPALEADVISASMTMPQGSPVETTGEAVARLEAGASRLRQHLLAETGRDHFVHVLAVVGDQPMAARGSGPITPVVGVASSTENLVNLLLSDPETRRGFHWIEYQYEPFDYTPEGTARSKGSVDMAIILDQDRDTYLAYECKRLNELRDDGRRSLAGRYVTDGLSRFVEGQYSDNLPVGCMLGYVLDGDVQYAAARVRAAIVERGQEVALDMMPRDDIAIGVATRFYSRHLRGSKGAVIEVRHALLPM